MTAVPGPRPQPLGALPFPAGMLLLPDTAVAAEAASAIAIGTVPERWPDELSFMALALQEEPQLSASALPGDDLVARYNRAVLLGGDDAWTELAAATEGEFAALVDVGRFTVGLIDEPPAADACTGEVRALVLSARASACLERGDFRGACSELAAAIDAAREGQAPILAASLALTLAGTQRNDLGDARAAALTADLAIQRLPLTAPRELRAELQVERALARQELAGTERGALLAVVADLTEAVKVFREDSHREMFALCNWHLALAYLVMPMNDEADRIRIGVAVNSLRAALKVYQPDTHPQQWASTQMNLANALQYLPSVHQEENLDEAVQLYEELLQARTRDADPLGYARILANQGNALGHLGVFSDARERLESARRIFIEVGDSDSAQSVDGILAGLDEAQAAAGRA